MRSSIQTSRQLRDGLYALDWLGTLNALRIEGKIDRIGVSIRDFRPNEGVDLARLGLADSIQVVFNMFEQRPTDALFPRGAETTTAFIARAPLDSGCLAGSGRRRPIRNGSPARSLTPSLAEAAMRCVLGAPQLSTLIPGMKNRGEVDMNVVYSVGAAFPDALAAKMPGHRWIRNYYK